MPGIERLRSPNNPIPTFPSGEDISVLPNLSSSADDPQTPSSKPNEQKKATLQDQSRLDLIRFDSDGLIADFTVMLRPLSGLVPFAQAMGEKVTQAGLQTTRG